MRSYSEENSAYWRWQALVVGGSGLVSPITYYLEGDDYEK